MIHSSRFRTAEAAVLVLLFFAALIAPVCHQLTHPALLTDLLEKRDLAAFPEIPEKWKRLKSWDNFPNTFTTYYNDHFGLREALLKGNAWIRLLVFHSSLSPRMMVGRSGWFFYTGEESTQDYQGTKRLSESQLRQWQEMLEARQAWLARRGILYLFVFAPNKQSIYPEYLPSRVAKLRVGTMLDQLDDYLRAHCSVSVLDLRAPVLAAKSRGQLFWKGDTHWSSLGARSGYEAIMAELHSREPLLAPRPYAGVEPDNPTRTPGDLGRMALSTSPPETLPSVIGARPVVERPLLAYPDGTRALPRRLFVVEPEAPETPLRAVIFRDSFFTALVPMVSPHFARSVYYWRINMDPVKREQILAALLEQEKPRVFIEEMVERYADLPVPPKDVFGGVGGAVAFPGKSP